jgi:transposase-like protein
MTDAAGSLIQAAAQADRTAPAFSFFPEIQEAEKRLAEEGEFTGERLFRDRPGIYAAVVRMAAEGQSISATARALGVSRNTVCAVRDREGISIEQDKKELLKDLRKASRLSVEKVIELLPSVKAAKDAAITAAVMLDKYQLLSGEATSRVERVEAKPDQVKAFLDALPVVDAEVLEVISTGIGEETPGQMGAAAPAAVPALPAPSDIKSDDMARMSSDDAAIWATPRTTTGFETPPPGGEGVDDRTPPLSGGMDTEKQNFGQRANLAAPPAGDSDLGGPIASKPLCKRTKKKQGGGRKPSAAKPTQASSKAAITKKKKGGSAS